jgi:hypothetical protein
MAESAAIVLSILFAFAIDAGWDYRQDREEERRVLVELREEYARYADRLAARAESYDSVAATLEWLLNESEGDVGAPVERFDVAFGPLVGAPTFEFSSEVLAGLVGSGRVGIILSEELRSRLSFWAWVRANAVEDEAVAREYIGSVLVPFLASRGLPMGRSFATWRGERWRIAQPDAPEAIRVYREVVADPEFRGLVQWRYDWALSSAGAFRRAAGEAEEIHGLIEAQLAN